MREDVVHYKDYRCRAIVYQDFGLPIVFLHGYSFSCDVWRDINVLDHLYSEKIPFIALDMPYGVRSGCSPKTRNPVENVELLRVAVNAFFGSVEPLIVGASYGGYIALKYAMKYPVSGMLLIAPVGTSENDIEEYYSRFNKPVHVILGSHDDIVDHDELKNFVEKLPNGRLKVYTGAKHPAYLDKPSDFKKDLLELYRIVVKG